MSAGGSQTAEDRTPAGPSYPSPPTQAEREAFYEAAVVGLCLLDARDREPRRLGAEATARWEQFRGALGPGDRLDVLLRDAAVAWGVAFSPAQAFSLFGLAPDEPFGPDWAGIADDRARSLIGDTRAPDLAHAAEALGVKPESVSIPKLSPSTRLLVGGGAAILAVAEAFRNAPTLSWSSQVLVVAERAVFRQLAGLAAVSVGGQGRTTLVRPTKDVNAALRAASVSSVDAVIISSDAEPAVAEFARAVKAGR